MPAHPHTHTIPLLIHIVNVSALLLGGVLLLTTVTRTSQLLVLVPVLALLMVYGRLRKHPSVVAWYCGMAIALLGWIFLCEQIVILDKVLGTHISEHLRLGVRLATYSQRTLHTAEQRGSEVEACCEDPLTWHYRPGSRYRATFDCPTCNAPYEVTVDETGYLNQPLGLMQHQQQIDMRSPNPPNGWWSSFMGATMCQRRSEMTCVSVGAISAVGTMRPKSTGASHNTRSIARFSMSAPMSGRAWPIMQQRTSRSPRPATCSAR